MAGRRGKIVPQDKIDGIIMDWRTGEYTIEQLASKHKTSTATVGKNVKGVAKDLSGLVQKGFEYNQALRSGTEKFVETIEKAVDYRVKISRLSESFVEKSIKKSIAMLGTVEDAQSIKYLSEAVDRNTITAGVNERHARPSQINNTVQTANFSSMNEDDLQRERKLINERLGIIK